jgi:putative Ca2+/H+ antiporter (TMEM165/GDT1 family)
LDLPAAGGAFALLFLMEIGDKTQLAVLSLTAKTRRVFLVFIAAALALVGVTFLGVAVGTFIAEVVPLVWVRWVSALAFIALGLYLLWGSFRGEAQERKEEEEIEERSRAFSYATPPARVFLGAFGLLFLAEMGDKSQLSVLSLTVRSGSPVEVFLGSSLALAAVTLVGALAGGALARIVPEVWVTRGAALVFIAIGVLTLAGVV